MRGHQRLLMLICVCAFSMTMHGCSKRELATSAIENDYSPAAVAAYPSTNSITVKWTPNSEAETYSGFGGYYVYCTTRANGFAKLTPDSFKCYEIAAGLKNVDSCLIDTLASGEILYKGTIYYIAIRSMIDGVLGGNSPTVMSSPRPEGTLTLYAYVTGDSTYCMMSFNSSTGLASRAKTLNRVYVDSVEDSSATPVSITVNSYGAFGLAYNPPRFIRIRRLTSDTTARDTTIIRYHTGVGLASDTTTAQAMDIVAQVVASGTQVQMLSPKSKDIVLYDRWLWNYKGRATLIQYLPGGWRASTPNITDDSRSVTITAGNAYQIKTISNYYAKIIVDSLYDVNTTPNNIVTKKIVLRYAYQLAKDPYSAEVIGLNNF
jgi:hypothetical protein